MAKTEPKGHYEGTPGARKTGMQVTTWKEFEGGLQEREADIASMLPQHVSKAKFMATAVAAVKQNPDLLKASSRSLFAAVTKSAQDGILPDGREGVITAYGGEAKWNPMAAGLRKRARELDGILIDAQVVHANDHFVWHQGDTPHIEHEPAKLGEQRGEMIGAYAIFKREDGTVLHREVMDRTDINTVKGQSKAQNSLMWTTFLGEAWRKTVVRRGIKSVPCSEKLETIVRRDDADFDMTHPPEQIALVGTKRPERADFIEGTAKPADTTPEPEPHNPDGGEIVEGDAAPADQSEPPTAAEVSDWLDAKIVEAKAVTDLAILEEMDPQVWKYLKDQGRDKDLGPEWDRDGYLANKRRLQAK